MDEIEQLLFIYYHSSLACSRNKLNSEKREIFKKLNYLFDNRTMNFINSGYDPSRMARSKFAQDLFNRMIQYQVNINSMKAMGGVWESVAQYFLEYEDALDEFARIDFAHMQAKMLDFLDTSNGDLFLDGNELVNEPPLVHILVDEYQDTNPIQSNIYFKLASRPPHNLTVVGDDDQALYRFRGASVESMINFDIECNEHWGVKPEKISLRNNYRSHPKIVRWCNNFITSFPTMRFSGTRIHDKPELVASSGIQGAWPAVRLVRSNDRQELANLFADTIINMLNTGIIQKVSDCVFLAHSTQEKDRWALRYTEALMDRNIPIYNPRSKAFLENEEVILSMGVLLSILDHAEQYPLVPDYIKDNCERWRLFYQVESVKYPTMRDYVEKSIQNISRMQENSRLTPTLQDIFYHILNIDPFNGWLDDPERGPRLGYITNLLETYSYTPVPNYPGLLRGNLRTSREKAGVLSWMWLHQFYNSFIGMIIREGLDDPEELEGMIPHNRVPFLTIHQAKGLEFPIVFVAGIESANPIIGGVHRLEDELGQFRKSTIKRLDPEIRCKIDIIRMFFVAYSRAQYSLVILLRDGWINPGENNSIALGGGSVSWFKENVDVLEL